MLNHVEIENFRALRHISVPLRPLSVLIGVNDSGKSSFLSALQQMASFSKNTVPPLTVTDQWRCMEGNKIKIIGDVDGRKGGLWPDRYISIESLFPCSFFQLPVKGVPMVSTGESEDHGPPILGEDGSKLPSLLDYLLRRDRRRFFSIVDAMNHLVPGLQDVEIATPDPSLRRIDLLIENGLHIRAEQASAGVRLLLFFVALSHHPTPPKLILLEEPETGIHPRRMADVMHFLREMTQGVYGGHAAQVVLTTHSPYLLDLVNPELDQVLVFRREPDGSRTAEPADTERLRAFLDEQFLLGEVWFNQGEEGLVAKQS